MALFGAGCGRLEQSVVAPLHLLARPSRNISDVELVALAEARGLSPSPLSVHGLSSACGRCLLLSFTNTPQTEAAAAARVLYEAIGSRLAPHAEGIRLRARPGSAS
jgi:hypothetical protein